MEYGIGIVVGNNNDRNVIKIVNCSNRLYEARVWLNDECVTDTSIPYLVKFSPQSEFCTIIPLETLRGK
jgi:hypothetical protein